MFSLPGINYINCSKGLLCDSITRFKTFCLSRLGLERGKTAKEALDQMTSLLEKHGQGGSCAEGEAWSYHNSYIIADRTEAWVLETAGDWWAAEKVNSRFPIKTTKSRISRHVMIHEKLLKYIATPSPYCNMYRDTLELLKSEARCTWENFVTCDRKNLTFWILSKIIARV